MNIEKHRDFYFDNLKFMLILLVVVGHVIEPIININYGAKFMYIFIYSFHMPLFVFVSGYFSKNYKWTNLINKILVTYMVFQVLYFLFERYVLVNPNYNFTLFTPYWIMWYMLSLFTWQLMLPLFKFKYGVIAALALGILAGYSNHVGYFLSLSRTLSYFLFFIIGNRFDKDKLFKFVSKKYQKALSVIFIIAIGIILYLYVDKIDVRLLYGSYSYDKLGLNVWYSGIYRLLLYAYTILVSICILYLIPQAKNYFSFIGGKTINVYLLHGFIMKLLIKYSVYDYLQNGYKIYILILMGIAITYVLSLKIFDNIVRLLSLKAYKR